MNARIGFAAVTTTLLLATTACNGSDDTAASTVATTVVTTSTTEPVSSTELSTTSTTEAPTTTPTTTSPPTSTVPETTAVDTTAPTTSEPEDQTDVAVGDALLDAREAYLYAVYNLDAPDATDRLTETHAAGSPSLELALENVQTLIDNGWLVRPNPDIPDTVTIESDPVMVDEVTAEIVACVVGAGEVYEPAGNADGSDLIVNGDIEAALNRVTMVFENGRWKLSEGTNLNTVEGTECVAE